MTETTGRLSGRQDASETLTLDFTDWSAFGQHPAAIPLPSLPPHVRLAVFDGSAVSAVGFPWGRTCLSCSARLVPTTAFAKDYRRCRLCRVLTVLSRRQRRIADGAEREWCREMFVRLCRYQKRWCAFTEWEWVKARP